MYKDVKRAVKVKSYTSVSELIRAAVRKILKTQDKVYSKSKIKGYSRSQNSSIL